MRTDASEPGPATERVRVRRRAERGRYDVDLVHSILDEALLCRLGFVHDGQPYVLPTLHVRRGGTLYIHGSHANRMLDQVATGAPVCVEATIVDSLVMGRSVFQNSMNYRSVVVLGSGTEVLDPELKHEAMVALVNRVTPGRVEHLRPLTDAELRSTRVVALPLDESSAKVRTGFAVDKESDYELPVWAGELPLRIVPGTPLGDPHVPADRLAPEHVRRWGSDRQGV